MKALILFFSILSMTSHADTSFSSEQLKGMWRMVSINSSNGPPIDLNNGQLEMKFYMHGYMQLRVVEPTVSSSYTASEVEGYYEVNDSTLKMTFLDGVWDESNIKYNEDIMELTPLVDGPRFTTVFKRIDGWTIEVKTTIN
jgi:hypothetical protein